MNVPTINLLPRETLVARDRRRWVQRWAIVVVGCVVMVGVGVAGNLAPAMSGQDVVERRLATVRARVREIDGEIPAAREQLADVTRRLRASERVQLRPDWGALLAYLDQLRGEDVVLERVGVSETPDGKIVLRLRGLSGVQGREGTLVLGLERSGLFERTTLIKTQRISVLGSDRISFEVESVFADAGEVLVEAPAP